MFAEERRQHIVELIGRKKKVTVRELCERFGASSGTIRSDLDALEELDLLSRTHGGAISTAKTGFERKAIEREMKQQAEKSAIAAYALTLVEDGDTIALDTGTTTLQLARMLTHRQGLTVVTNDLAIAMLLETNPGVTVLFIGGQIRRNFHCAVGPAALTALADIRVDKAFVAANGVSTEGGLSTPDIDTAQIKREWIRIADEVVLLCDSSKIGRTSFMRFANLQEVDLLVTDSHLPGGMKTLLEESGLQIVCAVSNGGTSVTS